MVNSLSLSHFASIVISLIGGLTVIAFRMRSSDKPTTLKKNHYPSARHGYGVRDVYRSGCANTLDLGMIAFVAGACCSPIR